MTTLEPDAYLSLIDLALAEDVGDGDVTSLAVIPPGLTWSAQLVARESLVVAGLSVFQEVFRTLDSETELTLHASDGDRVRTGAVLVSINGRARSILGGERVALNFVQRLSGIATLTRTYVDRVGDLPCEVLDTRKTTPGWRLLEKYAVQCGGGHNHRMGLFDMIMIKDNHLAVLEKERRPIEVAVQRARKMYPSIRVEVEADTVMQAEEAASAGADVILLDNMSLDEIRECLQLIDQRSKTEASGGITLETVRSVAETGVDYISIGALTHSAQAVDLALDIDATIPS